VAGSVRSDASRGCGIHSLIADRHLSLVARARSSTSVLLKLRCALAEPVLAWRTSREILRQLRARASASADCWREYGVPEGVAVRLSDLVCELFEWPRGKLRPEDSLALLIDSHFDFMGLPMLLDRCNQIFAVRLDPTDIPPDTSIGHLAQLICRALERDKPDQIR
jgi:hypothetical protein